MRVTEFELAGAAELVWQWIEDLMENWPGIVNFDDPRLDGSRRILDAWHEQSWPSYGRPTSQPDVPGAAPSSASAYSPPIEGEPRG